MLQDNPLLAQLKQQLHSQTPRIEGIVKANPKGFGFLEVDNKKSYFISANHMKKLFHGDKVSGVLVENGDKTSFEPETLIESNVDQFLGQINFNKKIIEILPENSNKQAIRCKVNPSIKEELKKGDWVKVKLINHPLSENKNAFAEVIQFICEENSPNKFWLIALARQNLESNAPDEIEYILADDERLDLTDIAFFTIDSKETKDMDDALSIKKDEEGQYKLKVAIADPSAYVKENSSLDDIAYQRCFSTYLPNMTIPMLPKTLSNELCSLQKDEKRPAVVCEITITASGDIVYDDAIFNLAWITSKAKLNYSNVSDFIDKNTQLESDNQEVNAQLILLAELAKVRTNWRKENALAFKDAPEYRFIFDENRNIVEIAKDMRSTANKMVEEAMVIANQFFSHFLKEKLGFGLFNIHNGFEEKHLDSVIKILGENNIEGFDKECLSSFDGYIKVRHLVEENEQLEYRLRRFQSPADFSITAQPHFALGFESYATWTSPIRKYGDLVNHRLLKKWLNNNQINQPDDSILSVMNQRRKATRFAEREVNTRLYANYFSDKLNQHFNAQIIDINRGGIKVRLTDNGAVAFIPLIFIHADREQIEILSDEVKIKINDLIAYQLLDEITVAIQEVKLETSNIVAKIVE